MSKSERIDKVISNSENFSRAEARKIIKNGRVKVNGVIIKDISCNLNPETDIITVFDRVVKYKKHIYIMMNKPGGVITASRDKNAKTVMDLLPSSYLNKDVFPAGRLDKDTEGLLLFTNDGELVHKILSPKKHIPKKYYVKLDKEIDSQIENYFLEGIVLDDGYKTLPSEIEIGIDGDMSTAYLTIYEGKFHQVKRMFEALNYKVLYLKRVKMGGLELDKELMLGEWKEIYEDSIKLIFWK